MPTPANDRADRAARWQRIYNQLPPEARETHDREKARRRQLRETRERALVEEAIRSALAEQLPRALAEASALAGETSAPDVFPLGSEGLQSPFWDTAQLEASDQPAEEAEPGKPLHEMTQEEWTAHRLDYWQRALPRHRTTPNLSFLRLGMQHDDSGAGEG